MRVHHQAGASVGTCDQELPSGLLAIAKLSLCAVLTLSLVAFDHAWTLSQDGFLE